MADSDNTLTLDTTDVDRYVGKELAFAEFWDECSATDIRRWVQAMDYPNPAHWNEQFARNSKYGKIIAPQSFTVAMDYGHGCHPSCVGNVPGTHLIFAGEEWWFYGTPIFPGDKLTQKRTFEGYNVKDTGFAGPTMFSDGVTVHRNQHGSMVAKEKATSIRYLVEEAKKRGVYGAKNKSVKRWTREEIEKVNKIRFDWIMSNREGVSPAYGDVKVGDELPMRAHGPHTVWSFANECRAHKQNIWGTWRWNPPEGVEDPALADAGFGEDMTYDFEARKVDPRMGDGLYHGPSSGHVNADKGENIGMGGTYGYGSSMNAWHLDYVAYWAGLEGYIWHSKTQFRSPAFEGDVTYITGTVIEKMDKTAQGMPMVKVETVMKTQDDETILKGIADVSLPY